MNLTFGNQTIDVIALASAIAAILAVIIAFWPLLQQLREKRLLSRSFGSELYVQDEIWQSTRYYIPIECSNVDPAGEAEIKNVIAPRSDLFTTIDEFLNRESRHRHMLILADSGMGKTSCLINYYVRNQRRSRSERIALVPLGRPGVDEYIDKIEKKNETILFLDAFDEDTKAIDDHRERLAVLMDICRDFKRIVITCRTQFFMRDEEIPKEVGIARITSTMAGQSKAYEFLKVYLSPLSDKQINKYLRKRYPGIWNYRLQIEARRLVNTVPLLSVRPMLLTHIPELLKSKKTIQYSFELYEALIEAWLLREQYWAKPEALRAFSEKLAVDVYVNRAKRGGEHVSTNELRLLADKWNISLDGWKLSGRSLLNRDAEGNFKFAHRSIMEYLFITCRDALLLDYDWSNVFLTDQMVVFVKDMLGDRKRQLLHNLPSAPLSGANLSGSDLIGVNLYEADLGGANLGGANLHGANLRKANLSKAHLFKAELKLAILNNAILHEAHIKLTNLVLADLSGADLTSAILSSADLTGSNLDGADLSEADLKGACFGNVNLSKTKLRRAIYDLSTRWPDGFDITCSKAFGPKCVFIEADLQEINLSKVDLSESNLNKSNLNKANLKGANLTKANLSRTYLIEADLQDTNLIRVDLSGADLSGANLRSADLRGANLSKARLQGASLSGAILGGANLIGTAYDTSTVWPVGFDPLAIGAILQG